VPNWVKSVLTVVFLIDLTISPLTSAATGLAPQTEFTFSGQKG